MNYQEKEINRIDILIFLVVFIWLIPIGAASQTPEVTAISSQENIKPNEEVSITFSVDTAVDAYYFGVEAVFDPDVFEFVSANPVGLMSDGMRVADLLNEDRVGASVSLTSPLDAPDSGDLLKLTFRVKQATTVGLSQISFEHVELSDSEGRNIEIVKPEALDLNVEEAVSDLQLVSSEDNNITEGEEFQVEGSIYVNDITVDENTESDRITVWVGINENDTDPSGWAEVTWTEMVFDNAQNSYHQYKKNIGFGMEPGTYYIALRGKLDSGSYVYGGQSNSGGGLWDGVENVNARLTVTEQSAYQHTLAGWNFDDETLVTSQSVPANEDNDFQLIGASKDGFSSIAASGMAASSDGWQFTEGDEKYWLAELSSEGFQNVTVFSKQYSTGAGPRDFELEASIDGLDWEVVSPDTINVASDWSSGVIDKLALPAKYDDQQNIYVRWIRRGDFRADGQEDISTGSNRMDDVYIQGENINAQDVTVWPGDCDDNGVVEELDVFEIGQYWLAEGPTPVYNSIGWAQREVESWIPAEAAYADANGDGVVNHKDLKPLGLHFGKNSTSSKQSVKQSPPLSELVLPALNSGESVVVAIKAEEAVDLTGLSIRFRVADIDGFRWDLKKVTYADWGSRWDDDNKLIEFSRRENNSPNASATWVYKGESTPETTDSLAVLEIEANENWKQQARLILERVVVADNEHKKAMENVMLESEHAISDERPEEEPELPQSLSLNQNYPNPFNPSTVISYTLPKDEEISIVLYDMVGRKVTTIFEGAQQAGRYALRYRPAGLSSGVYIYQLKTKERVISRKFTYVK
ncbi:T9SS type A sorting domain-containing protein [Fodinibius sp.]|uniref:T9SS type A sorting domain-containing protein n=1 Tax=Fodinibius sp. TaxID=1872440 RepID=UPI002ACE39BA|nr:T9SS type A sorting domain-containing protein [Fodinibius sp.]MDZ7657649.1 T9SS type A sorting domain-containing protein [Fodinibius sp.]